MNIPVKVQDYWVPLSEASRGDKGVDKGVSLVESPVRVYKLDDISEQVCDSLRLERLSGCDAFRSVFRETDGAYWFIEFKNSPSRNIKKKQIWKKAFDSVSMVRTAINQEITLDDLCQKAVFFVVYKDEDAEERSPLERIMRGTASLAGEEPVFWDLGGLKGILYRNIHTIPKSKFCKTWLPILEAQDGGAPSGT